MSADATRKPVPNGGLAMLNVFLAATGLFIGWITQVSAAAVASCGGVAMLGGAQINCSHVVPTAPPQLCTFSWTLVTTLNSVSTVQGSFLLWPGTTAATVYQGSGFASALSGPVILCQGRRSR